MPKSTPGSPSTGPGASCPIDQTTQACAAIPKGCEYLNKPYTVEAPVADFDRTRGESKLGPPKATKHTFPGDSAPSDAIEQVVDVKGKQIKVITPQAAAPAGKHLPSAEQIAKSLAAVPADQLNSIQQVVVSPKANPSDAYWAVEYKQPNFSSAATGGNKGVTFYPKSTPWDQAFVDSTTIHEGGHTYSQDLWKDADKKKAWEEVIKKDAPNSPSKYADSAPTEDFSESLVMYSLSKGTPCEATARKLYPNRYAALEEMFKGNAKPK
jgi:type VI secretion system secreted protein VgrG